MAIYPPQMSDCQNWSQMSTLTNLQYSIIEKQSWFNLEVMFNSNVYQIHQRYSNHTVFATHRIGWLCSNIGTRYYLPNAELQCVVLLSFSKTGCSDFRTRLIELSGISCPEDLCWNGIMYCTVDWMWLFVFILFKWDLFSHYPQISNISRAFEGNKLVDHPDVVGASSVGAVPSKSSFST